MGNLFVDLKGGWRGIRRSPLFAVIVAGVLALGIGAASALFAVVDSVLLHSVPGPQPDRLMALEEYGPTHEISGGSPQRFLDWQRAHSFQAMCALYADSAILNDSGRPVRLRILHTFGDPVATFQQPLLQGRAFTTAEKQGEGSPVALLTSSAWRRHFAADPAILKRLLHLGANAYQVVGILDSDAVRGVEYPEDIDLWTPATGDVLRAPRQAGFLEQIGRLAPGVSIDQARSEIAVLTSRMETDFAATDKGRSAVLLPLQEEIAQAARAPLLTLWAAVGAVLLIACVNIAGLLLARGLARQREAAIRIAAGAGFFRLARLFFAESLILAAAGCAGGICAALVGIRILKLVLPPDVPHLASLNLDWRAAGCAVLVSLLCAFLFGAVPAWQFAMTGQASALKGGGRGVTDTRHARWRASLVVLQVALCLVLLVAAGLLASSFFRLRDRAPGFSTANAYSFGVPFGWDTGQEVLNSFSASALTRLTTSPGVIAAGVVDRLPLHGGSQSGPIQIQGMTFNSVLAEKQFSWRTASAGYFSAAGIPVVSGVLYRDWANGKGGREAVITSHAAALLFPQGDALGRLVARAPRGKDLSAIPTWFRIAGVVGNVNLNPADPNPEAGIYVPWGATYWPELSFVVKTTGDLSSFTRLVRNHIQPLTNLQVVEAIGTLESRTAETRSTERIRAAMIGSFAAAALALAAIGLFGLLSHEVSRRTQDYGVRLALGAEPSTIAWSAVRSALVLAGVGVAFGVGLSIWASQFIASQLFGVDSFDITAYLSAAAVLLATAMLAAALPALRAARIDPIQALRHE